MAHLFLDELQVVFRNRILWSVNRGNLSSFHRSDYHRPEIDCLEKAVRQTMSEQLKEKMEELNLRLRLMKSHCLRRIPGIHG